MNDFLDMPVRENFTPCETLQSQRVLDPDLDITWIGAAEAHLGRRGYTLRSALAYISIHCPAYRNTHWTQLRKVLVGRVEDPRLLFAIRALPDLVGADRNFVIRAKRALVIRGTNVTEVAAAIGRSRVVTSQAINHGLHEPTRKLIAQHLGIAA